MNQISRLTVIGLCATLAACSVLDGDKINYKSAGKAPTLEVPPDLTQLARDTRYAVPGSAVSAASFQLGQATPTQQTAVSTLGDVQIQRAGNQRWLVVHRSADQLWQPIHDFWLENGFLLTLERVNMGIMETDWAENRAKIPQDFIRSTIGKWFDSVYSTGERDKFRTRLERNDSGGTDIFISHRGMIEVYDSSEKVGTIWQPRPTDPELEIEFLRRLMVKLGVSPEQVKALTVPSVSNSGAHLSTAADGQPRVQIDDGFDRAWRRVGLSLDRTSFTVEDRDRSRGLYFVRYVEPSANKAEPGFFSQLFGSAKVDPALNRYRIAVASQGAATNVTVQDAAGKPVLAATAQQILKLIADDLK